MRHLCKVVLGRMVIDWGFSLNFCKEIYLFKSSFFKPLLFMEPLDDMMNELCPNGWRCTNLGWQCYIHPDIMDFGNDYQSDGEYVNDNFLNNQYIDVNQINPDQPNMELTFELDPSIDIISDQGFEDQLDELENLMDYEEQGKEKVASVRRRKAKLGSDSVDENFDKQRALVEEDLSIDIFQPEIVAVDENGQTILQTTAERPKIPRGKEESVIPPARDTNLRNQNKDANQKIENHQNSSSSHIIHSFLFVFFLLLL